MSLDIKALRSEPCERIYEVNGTKVRLWTIVGGTLATALGGYSNHQCTKRWNKIPEDATTKDSPKLEWIEDQAGFEDWFNKATMIKATLNRRESLTYKEAFRYKDRDILIVTVKFGNYVSVTADQITPMSEDEAININDQLAEDSLLSEDPKEDEELTEYYIGTLELFDNSLYCEEFKYNGQRFLYWSVGCGCMHEAIESVDSKFEPLIDLHLNKDQPSYYKAHKIVSSWITQQIEDGYDLDEAIYNIAYNIVNKQVEAVAC